MTDKELNTGEPVAWMFVLDGCRCVTLDEDVADEVRYNGTPLYTNPVKELTKNITGVWRMSDQSIQIVFTSCRSASEFEAILRKASDK